MRKELGEGAFGTVHEAMHRHLNTLCAVKQITKSKFESKTVEKKLMESELKTLHKYDHPHIVRVLDLCEDDTNIYIVLELVRHGDLAQNIQRIKETGASFTEKDCANLIK